MKVSGPIEFAVHFGKRIEVVEAWERREGFEVGWDEEQGTAEKVGERELELASGNEEEECWDHCLNVNFR